MSPLSTSELAWANIFIRGRSGSGKSSVQALLLRFYDVGCMWSCRKFSHTSSARCGTNHVQWPRYVFTLACHFFSLTLCSDIRDFTPASWRANIGLVPQDPVLFSGTIAENIAYDRPDASLAEIEEVARIANCEFIWDMALKFETKSVYTRVHLSAFV